MIWWFLIGSNDGEVTECRLERRERESVPLMESGIEFQRRIVEGKKELRWLALLDGGVKKLRGRRGEEDGISCFDSYNNFLVRESCKILKR